MIDAMAKQAQITLPLGTKVPDHVAMILDGNRRWARARGLKPWEGHKAGFEAVKKIANASRELGVHTFTVWAFSTENWERAREEIDEIMNILRFAFKDLSSQLHKDKVRLVHLGRKDRFPEDIQQELIKLERETKEYGQHTFNVALDYGGHDELVRAVHRISNSKFPINQLTTKNFGDFLDTGDQPYPNVDLFIRTSGEQRTSGLLPWQMEYAEYYFENDHLPDFSPEKFREAILDYSRRRRRYGVNDVEEHLKFDPKLVAGLELKWRHELSIGETERLSDLVIRYVQEHYGLSKELAKSAAVHLLSALRYKKTEDWVEAKSALVGLYEIVKKSVGLAMEPEIVANFEVKLWRKSTEEDMRSYLAEKFRFSEFQSRKSAHLAFLANEEMDKQEWTKAKGYLEKYYEALKERVA